MAMAGWGARQALTGPRQALAGAAARPPALAAGGRLARWMARRGLAAKRYTVREDKVQLKAVRGSGPGGQNVNKVATCVELRLAVQDAHWLPEDVRGRLAKQERNRVNKHGELVLQAQEERTQVLNKRRALARLQDMVDRAAVEPKKREMWTGLGEETKERRRNAKRQRSKIKQARRVRKDEY